MPRLLSILTLALTCLGAWADGYGSHIVWGEWRIETSELLSEPKTRIEHPLTYLVDGDPDTAWMFHRSPYKGMPERRPSVEISRVPKYRATFVADEVWLMNGFNKSEELFKRNNRVVEVKLWNNGQLLKTVALADRMGWHKIAIPPEYRSLHTLRLEFTKLARGRDNDLCLSELALYNKGEKLDLHMPPYVLYSAGNECGCGGPDYHIISRSGYPKVNMNLDEGAHPVWSPGGRYIAGVCSYDRAGKPPISAVRVWDIRKGKSIYRHELPTTDPEKASWRDPKWLDDATIEVTLQEYGKEGKDGAVMKRERLTVR